MPALPFSCDLCARRAVPALRVTAIAALLVLTGCAGLPGAAPGTGPAGAAAKRHDIIIVNLCPANRN